MEEMELARTRGPAVRASLLGAECELGAMGGPRATGLDFAQMIAVDVAVEVGVSESCELRRACQERVVAVEALAGGEGLAWAEGRLAQAVVPGCG